MLRAVPSYLSSILRTCSPTAGPSHYLHHAAVLHSSPQQPNVIPSSQKQENPKLSQFSGHELPPTLNPAGSQDIHEGILKKSKKKYCYENLYWS